MKEKGFTLIELLAVIVILAIIALIAVPLVLNIIRDSKEKSALISVDNYLRAVENAVAKETMKNPNTNYDGKYTINSDGKVISSTEKGDITIEFNGEGLKSGIIVIGDGKVKESGLLKVDNINIKVDEGKINILESIEKSYLVSGINFNEKIKTLVTEKETRYDTQDTKIKEIEFLGYGLIADGYTLEEFQRLERVDISEKQDKKVYAIYDGTDKVYIYSDSELVFNKDSSSMLQSFMSIEKILFGEYIDTSNVEKMSYMFASSVDLNILDISNFNTSNVTNMHGMFQGCSNLTSLNLNHFNTSKVTDMGAMFWECSKLKELKISNFDTSKLTSMWNMFNGCKSLVKLDVSSFDTSNVTNMLNLFLGTRNLKPIYVGEKWIINEGTEVSGMFTGSKTKSSNQLCRAGSTEEWCVITN